MRQPACCKPTGAASGTTLHTEHGTQRMPRCTERLLCPNMLQGDSSSMTQDRGSRPAHPAGREIEGAPPAGEEGGGVVVHVQEADLLVLAPQHHQQRVHELPRLRQRGEVNRRIADYAMH